MYKARVTYTKTKEATFISHLDLMKVMDKALRRADIPVCYSKGYNPRPEFVFAHPLSVGIESVGEVFDICLEEHIDVAYMVRELNKTLPSGIIILNIEYIDLNAKNIMASIYGATYEISIDYPESELANKSKKEVEDIKKWYQDKMTEYIEQPAILVIKKSRNRLERIDIKPSIIEYDFNSLDYSLRITIYTGQENNLKPEYIMTGYIEYIEKNIEYNIKRTKLLYKE